VHSGALVGFQKCSSLRIDRQAVPHYDNGEDQNEAYIEWRTRRKKAKKKDDSNA